MSSKAGLRHPVDRIHVCGVHTHCINHCTYSQCNFITNPVLTIASSHILFNELYTFLSQVILAYCDETRFHQTEMLQMLAITPNYHINETINLKTDTIRRRLCVVFASLGVVVVFLEPESADCFLVLV